MRKLRSRAVYWLRDLVLKGGWEGLPRNARILEYRWLHTNGLEVSSLAAGLDKNLDAANMTRAVSVRL
jgi:hypothetical protein